MLEENGIPDGPGGGSRPTCPDRRRRFGRRNFLGGAALAGLAAIPITAGTDRGGRAVAAIPPPLGPQRARGVSGGTYLDVRAFGARGDGKTDDTRAIQKAATRLAAQGGKLLFPAGWFVISSVIDVPIAHANVTLAGAGPDVTVLVNRQRDASIFSIDGNNTYTLSDMTLMGSAAARRGALLTTRSPYEHIYRCVFSTYYNGVNGLGNLGVIRDCGWRWPQSEESNGIIVGGPGGYGYAGGLLVDNAVMYDVIPSKLKPHSGIHVQSCGALQIANSNLMGHNYDLLIAPPQGRVVASVNAINTFFDSATVGVNISPQGGAVVRCSFSQCWASSHSKSGIYIGGSGRIDGIQFIGAQLNFNAESGISINAPAKNITIEGGEGVANGMAAVRVGDDVKGFMINHFFGGCGFGAEWGGGPCGNGYGIWIGKGCDNYQVMGCHLLGNKSGGIHDGSSSSAAKRIVVNNMA